jgi:hypothetical protein
MVLIALVAACAAQAQVSGLGQSTIPASSSRVPGGLEPATDGRNLGAAQALQEKMAIQRNDERQKKLVADTQRLYDLASQLKDDVAKTDKYTLSLDVVKRTAEIEKLAKSIRDRMKD